MKNNSKSGLKIKQCVGVFSILIILGTSIQFFVFTNENEVVLAKEEDQNIETTNMDLQSVQVAENYKREIEPTTRYGKERSQVNQEEQVENQEQGQEIEEQEKYISIEEICISKNMDLTVRCGISKEDFKILMGNLKSDTSGFFYRNSDTIYDLCEKYELNEVFFCGLIAAESGWNIASNHRRACNYISMMSKGKLIRYSSEEEGLEAAAKLLHNKYLTAGGSYYSGKTLASVQKRFCPNSSTWVNLVYGCMKQVV